MLSEVRTEPAAAHGVSHFLKGYNSRLLETPVLHF